MDGTTTTTTTTSTTTTAPETKFCKECGAKIAKKAVICPHCGCRVEEPATAAAQPQIVINNSNQNQNNNVNAGIPYGMKRCDKWVSLLLCIFLGMLGSFGNILRDVLLLPVVKYHRSYRLVNLKEKHKAAHGYLGSLLFYEQPHNSKTATIIGSRFL